MRRILLAACAAALTLPATAVAAHAASDTTAPAATAKTAAAKATSATTARTQAVTLATLRTQAFSIANVYAAQAPRASWRTKARNADIVARAMRLPNITVKERAIAVGKTQLGTMYRWGGTTPAGFDCSGFTRFSFAKAGKSLPRTAAAQQRAVPRTTSPRVGDLVFIGRPAHHVGIYVGNGKMLNSPRTGKAIQVQKIWATASYGRM